MVGDVKAPRKRAHLATSRFNPARRPKAPSDKPPPGVPADGRLQRSVFTRWRIVDSMISIVDSTGQQPTMAAVARHAGISLRALFVHFPNLESLVRAGSDLVRERAAGIVESIPPGAKLATRVTEYVAYRAAYFAELGKIWRVGYVLALSFPEVRANRADYRAGERARLARIFARELAALPAPDRTRRLAALAAVADFQFWEGLTEVQGLSAEEAAPIVQDTLLAILERR